MRLDPEHAGNWSDEDVVRRWGRLYPPRDKEVGLIAGPAATDS
jgi:hypothetical protein